MPRVNDTKNRHPDDDGVRWAWCLRWSIMKCYGGDKHMTIMTPSQQGIYCWFGTVCFNFSSGWLLFTSFHPPSGATLWHRNNKGICTNKRFIRIQAYFVASAFSVMNVLEYSTCCLPRLVAWWSIPAATKREEECVSLISKRRLYVYRGWRESVSPLSVAVDITSKRPFLL